MRHELRYCVIVGGAGSVGSMFTTLLVNEGLEMFVIDTIPPKLDVPFEISDITVPTTKARDAIKNADMVLLATPERVALTAVPIVCQEMRNGALLVHTMSVQSRIFESLNEFRLDLEVVGLNPMFAPNLNITGRPVAAIVQREGPQAQELLRLIAAWGGQVIELSARDHDKLAASMQALTHAVILSFGLALAELDIDIALVSSLAPPPHRTLLALLSRIVSGTPEVYWDIQVANDQAPRARAAFVHGMEQFIKATTDESEFVSVLNKTREVLGVELETYYDLCVRIFQGLLLQPD